MLAPMLIFTTVKDLDRDLPIWRQEVKTTRLRVLDDERVKVVIVGRKEAEGEELESRNEEVVGTSIVVDG